MNINNNPTTNSSNSTIGIHASYKNEKDNKSDMRISSTAFRQSQDTSDAPEEDLSVSVIGRLAYMVK